MCNFRRPKDGLLLQYSNNSGVWVHCCHFLFSLFVKKKGTKHIECTGDSMAHALWCWAQREQATFIPQPPAGRLLGPCWANPGSPGSVRCPARSPECVTPDQGRHPTRLYAGREHRILGPLSFMGGPGSERMQRQRRKLKSLIWWWERI